MLYGLGPSRRWDDGFFGSARWGQAHHPLKYIAPIPQPIQAPSALLDVITAAHPVIAQDAAVVPAFLDNGG